jgi:nicotinate-nucleotide--dimethylbenzimidazole phosphoribosyltransferase
MRTDMTREELEGIRIDPLDRQVQHSIKGIWDGIAKPLDGLGEFEGIISRIGAMTRSTQIDLTKKAVIIMCADNGIVSEGVSQSGQEITAIVADNLVKGAASVCKMARKAGVDLFPVDIGINREDATPGLLSYKIAQGTKNFRREPAMSEEEVLKAIGAGFTIASECAARGYKILATGEMGIGNTTTSSAMAAAMLPCGVEEITGKGAGLSAGGLEHKCRVIRESLDRYQLDSHETLRILATVGGFDIAGLAGVFIGGAVNHIPVVIDGVISAVAALTAQRLVPGTRDYMVASHRSREPGAKRILEELDLHPVLDASLALGEGTGAVMMLSLLDVVLTVYQERTTFEDYRMEQYARFPGKG